MPKARTLVNVNIEGNNVAVGEEVNLSDEDYASLRASGAVEASAEEAKAAQQEASPEGVYNARTSREETPKAAEESPRKK